MTRHATSSPHLRRGPVHFASAPGHTGAVPSGPDRALALLVGSVVSLAVVAGVVVANRSVPDVDPGTPEGVVQEFLQHIVDGDYPAAADLLAPSSGCDLSDVSAAYAPESARVVLEDSAVDGDRAVVTVDVTEGSGDDLFGSSGYSHTERITVERDDGAWKIAGSPWLLYSCGSTKG